MNKGRKARTKLVGKVGQWGPTIPKREDRMYLKHVKILVFRFKKREYIIVTPDYEVRLISANLM